MAGVSRLPAAPQQSGGGGHREGAAGGLPLRAAAADRDVGTRLCRGRHQGEAASGAEDPLCGGGLHCWLLCNPHPIPSYPIPSHPIPWFPILGFAPGPGRGLSPAGSAALPIPTVPRAAASLLLFATAFCHPVHAFPRGELGSPEPLCAPQGKLSPSPGARHWHSSVLGVRRGRR